MPGAGAIHAINGAAMAHSASAFSRFTSDTSMPPNLAFRAQYVELPTPGRRQRSAVFAPRLGFPQDGDDLGFVDLRWFTVRSFCWGGLQHQLEELSGGHSKQNMTSSAQSKVGTSRWKTRVNSAWKSTA